MSLQLFAEISKRNSINQLPETRSLFDLLLKAKQICEEINPEIGFKLFTNLQFGKFLLRSVLKVFLKTCSRFNNDIKSNSFLGLSMNSQINDWKNKSRLSSSSFRLHRSQWVKEETRSWIHVFFSEYLLSFLWNAISFLWTVPFSFLKWFGMNQLLGSHSEEEIKLLEKERILSSKFQVAMFKDQFHVDLISIGQLWGISQEEISLIQKETERDFYKKNYYKGKFKFDYMIFVCL